MKKLFVVLGLILAGSSWASENCPRFTPEQLYLLQLAKVYGDSSVVESINDTVGYTTAAIVWKESFIGNNVVRYNTKDGESGSWGVMMVQITTALHMDGYESLTWRLRADKAPRMITSFLNNDLYAISYGHRYLVRMINQEGSLWGGVERYNGRGIRAERYSQDVREKVLTLIRCGDSIGLYY